MEMKAAETWQLSSGWEEKNEGRVMFLGVEGGELGISVGIVPKVGIVRMSIEESPS